jgi:hypothetical protein
MADPQTSQRFQEIIAAARERNGSAGVDTMIVSGHLAQMRLFCLRQGVEFFPRQDTYGFRKQFLNKVVEENEVDARLEGIIDEFIAMGKGLWFFRPVRDTYRIMWFCKENYRAYYDAESEIEELDLVYTFRVRNPLGAAAVQGATSGTKERYVRLQVRRDQLIETISDEKPNLDTAPPSAGPTGKGITGAMGVTRTSRNSLGFIPAVEAFNVMRPSGMDATGDFDPFAEHILKHDELVANIGENLDYFGNPTLISSRPKSDLVGLGDDGQERRPTIASKAGFASMGERSSRHQITGKGRGGRGRVARIVANVEPNDRVGYITPNAVSGDQNLYARQYREEIRTALGGVDELGISSGATAYEIKSLFGRAATTAARKCRGLLTYGLCKLLSLMIFHEERVFRESFSAAIGFMPPPAPIKEEILQEEGATEETYYEALQQHQGVYQQYQAELELRIEEAIEAREFPDGVQGLLPDGDRRVEWRWRGPVFEESTEDVLNNSIVVRNLQELGVNSIEALKHLFPSKTDEERSAMLNGYPFRMAQATQQSIGTFLQLIAQMREIPHPQAPDLPLLADARLDLTPYLYRALDFLKRELTYAGQYGDAAGSNEPAQLNPVERARANAGLDVAAGSADEPDFVPDGAPGAPGAPGAAGADAAGGQPVAGGVSEPRRQFERDAAIPAPGATMAADPTGTGLPGSFLPFRGANLPGGFGDADFFAPSNAGLFADAAAELERAPAKRSGSAKRSGRVSRKRE